MTGTIDDATYAGDHPDLRGKRGRFVPGHPFSFKGEFDAPDGLFYPEGESQGYDCLRIEIMVAGHFLEVETPEPTEAEILEIERDLYDLISDDDEDDDPDDMAGFGAAYDWDWDD